jgi:hypothetical protein
LSAPNGTREKVCCPSISLSISDANTHCVGYVPTATVFLPCIGEDGQLANVAW